MKRFLPALLAALLFSTLLHTQTLIPFRDGARWGYCNPEGKIILPCIYTKAFPFNNNEAIAVLNDKYGLISPQGKWLLPAAYDSLGYFEPLAIFKKEGKYGLLDKKGTQLQPAASDRAEQLKSGFYLLTRGPYSGLVNSKGELVLPVAYRNVFDFREGRALVWKEGFNEPWSIINEKGDVVFQMKPGEGFYNNNEKYFRNGVLQYRTFSPNAGGGYYDSLGKILVYQPGACCNNPEERKLTGMYRKGLFPAEETAEVLDSFPGGYVGKLYRPSGYCDSTGNFVLKPVYSEAGEFENGLALVKRVKGFGLIDTRGREVIPLQYKYGRYVSPSRLLFRDQDKAFLYDTRGNLLRTYTNLKYESSGSLQYGMGNYSEGIAIVKLDEGQFAYVDSMGRFISNDRFTSCTPFSSGLGMVALDEEISYISKSGRLYFSKPVIRVGRQQWDYQDLNTRFFANGDSIYKAVSITDFFRKGQEKKPAFYQVSYIPNTQSKTRLLYNWYAVTDPRGLAPAGWMIPSVEEFEQMKKAVCADSLAPDILYAMGFDNGGQLLKETGLETRFEGRWWTRNPEPASFDLAKGVALLVSKDNQRSALQTGVYLQVNGLAVRCIRKPEPVKPGIKLPAIPKLNCDSLVGITKSKLKVVASRKIEPLKLSSDTAWKMYGKYRSSSSKLTLHMKPDVITSTSSSTLQIDHESEGLIYIRQDGMFYLRQKDTPFHMYFYMKRGAPYRSSGGDPLKTWIPLSDAGRTGKEEATSGNYARGENFSGTYCIETGEIRITATIIIMNGNQEITRGLYELTGQK